MFRKAIAIFVGVVTFLLLASCDQNHNLRGNVSPAVLKVTDGYINNLRDKKRYERYISPNMRLEPNTKRIQALANILQSDKLVTKDDYEIVYYTTHGTLGGTRHKLTYQLEFKNFWLLIHLSVDEIGGWQGISRQSFQPIPEPIQEMNAFTFKDKSWKHYVALGLFLTVVCFVLYVIWLWYKTKLPWKWKIFWLMVILIGLSKGVIDWNYGRYGFKWPTVRPVPVNIVHPVENGRWFLEVSFPIGAFIFLYQRRRWRRTEKKKAVVSKGADKIADNSTES